MPSKSLEKNQDSDSSALDQLQGQLEAVQAKMIETRQQLKKVGHSFTPIFKSLKVP